MLLLDTNILVYAANTNSEFCLTASKIREKAISGKIEGCVCLQNLLEFYSVITSSKRVEHPLPPEIASEEIRKYLEADKLIKLHFSMAAIQILEILIKKYRVVAQDVYDLKIVATMLVNKVTDIVTFDGGDFSKYDEIKVCEPQVLI